MIPSIHDVALISDDPKAAFILLLKVLKIINYKINNLFLILKFNTLIINS